ncbi:ADP-ribosylglycohydrolase family protein [Eubacteriaceae bacterium ES3]|nr:ADP-ribosylglycohydrolase family protein [Eubacteriaceae bacterium ES3]
MIGAIIGDVVGSRFEFDNFRSKDFELFTKDCFVTDDSIITLAVAKAIMEAGKAGALGQGEGFANREYYLRLEKDVVYYMQKIGRKYPGCGYGGRFGQWIFSIDPKPYNSFGNGAAMRISPAAWAAGSEQEARLFSEIITRVTHNHPEGLKGAEAVALAVFMAKNNASKDEIRERMDYFYQLDFTIDEIRGSYAFNETCQETVPQAIVAFLESDSFEDAIRTAISVGGDSDTLAAITGSIAEAYYGVPEEISRQALSYLDEEMLLIYQEFLKFMKEGPERLVVREAYQDEINKIIKEGYKHFPKDRSLEEYMSDNSQEDAYGNRYVLENKGEILCSLIILRLKSIAGLPVFGIGSLITHDNLTGKGYATTLLKTCISQIEIKSDGYIFLYSDIRPEFYQKLFFKILPQTLQKIEKSTCMVRCGEANWEKLLSVSCESIPEYF